MKRRGPWISPTRHPSFNPPSRPPARRTVGKPACSVSSIWRAIRSAITAGASATSSTRSRSRLARWTCASSSPGIRVRPWQSMTRASRGPAGPVDAVIRWIRPSATTTRELGCGSRPVQSRRVACSKTTLTARLVYLRGDVGQKEVRAVREQEPEEQSPGHRGRRVQAAADVEHFVDHVEEGAGGQGQEQHIDIGGGEEVADHGSKEGRGTADQAGEEEEAPRRHGGIGGQGRGDAEALGDVVEG